MINFIKNKKNVILAPMAGVGDYPFRKVVRRFGSELLYGEMISSEALIRNHPETIKLSTCHNDEQPVVIQIMGADPKNMARAAEIVEQKGTQWIDINMGCPVKKIVSNNSGSALMRDLNLAKEIIRQVVKVSKTMVSVKMRLGWDSHHLNVLELAKIAQEEGAGFITVHGRTKAQMYSGVADWEMIKQVKESVKIPVIGNGDINSPEFAKECIDKSDVDGIMIGRAAMGRPWLLSDVTKYLETGEIADKLPIEIIKETMLYQLDEIIDYYGEKNGHFIARKHMCWYAIGAEGAKTFRNKINTSASSGEIRSIITDFIG